jgi:hypothetical protein
MFRVVSATQEGLNRYVALLNAEISARAGDLGEGSVSR